MLTDGLQTLVTEWLHFGYGRVPCRLRNASKLWLRNGYTLVTEGSRVDGGLRNAPKLWFRNGYTLVTEGSRVDCGMPPTLVTEWLHFGYGRVPCRLRNASKLWLGNGYTLVTEGSRVDCGRVTPECLQTLVTEWLHFGYGRVPRRLRNAPPFLPINFWLRNDCTLVAKTSHVGEKTPPNCRYGMATLWL